MPAEAQGQVLAWMMGVLQATQGEMLRRQSEFQNDVIDALRQIQDDNNATLGKHLETVETLNQQLSSLQRRSPPPVRSVNRPQSPRAAQGPSLANHPSRSPTGRESRGRRRLAPEPGQPDRAGKPHLLARPPGPNPSPRAQIARLRLGPFKSPCEASAFRDPSFLRPRPSRAPPRAFQGP